MKDLGFSLIAGGTILKIKAGGYSMYPSVKPGTIIFIEALKDENDLIPGEIIAWKRESGFVAHRLIRIERKGDETIYITRGDSCATFDEPVTADQIAGRVIRTENREKRERSGEELIKKPCYPLNRIIVRFLLILKRMGKILSASSGGSSGRVPFSVILILYFVVYLVLFL